MYGYCRVYRRGSTSQGLDLRVVNLVQVFQEPRGVNLGSQAFIFGTTVLYGLYAPLVPVRFSIQGCEMIQLNKKA